jgi:hypothetical protein
VELERPLSAGAPKGEGEREEGVPALAVSATNAARSADSTRRLGLAGSCESWHHQQTAAFEYTLLTAVPPKMGMQGPHPAEDTEACRQVKQAKSFCQSHAFVRHAKIAMP